MTHGKIKEVVVLLCWFPVYDEWVPV